MTEAQHCFKNKRSCLTNLSDFYITYDKKDNRILSDTRITCLDNQKAFDKVLHECLLSRLQSAGIRANLGSWIKD